jgi:bacteriorhodopsin
LKKNKNHFMKKKNIILLNVLFLLAIAGYLVHHFLQWSYWGGICTGACLMLVMLATLGQRRANKAGERIDKIIRDNQK